MGHVLSTKPKLSSKRRQEKKTPSEHISGISRLTDKNLDLGKRDIVCWFHFFFGGGDS